MWQMISHKTVRRNYRTLTCQHITPAICLMMVWSNSKHVAKHFEREYHVVVRLTICPFLSTDL